MRGGVLGLWTAPCWQDEAGVEFLRILVALVACGEDVRLVEVGAGIGVLSDDDLPAPARRFLRGLGDSAIRIEVIEKEAMARLLGTCLAVVRVAPAQREGAPPVLVLGEETPESGDFDRAGQIVCGTR